MFWVKRDIRHLKKRLKDKKHGDRMNESRNKYLLKNTAIFALGNFAPKLVAFFLIPLYTNVLSTYDYGIIDLITTICTIAVPIITMNIAEGVLRFNLDKNVDRDKITKIGCYILIIGFVIGLVVLPISQLFDSISNISILIYLYVVFTASSQFFLYDLRGKELLIKYSIGNILNTFLIASLNILFLVVFKLGIIGYLLAYIFAQVIISAYAFVVGKSYKCLKSKLDYSNMKEMLKYSLVLIPNSFMWWIMNSSDHIMVSSMISIEANGIYAISYKIPTLITTLNTIFNQAWQYSAIREDGAKDEEVYCNSVFKSLVTVTMIIGITMMAVIKPFLKWYISADYFEAWQYTPFLIIGCVYLMLATFISMSYSVHKDSCGFLMSGSFGAILNVLLNFALIPLIDVYGAALATCISYIAVFLFRLIHTRKYIKYNILIKEFIVGTILLLSSSVLIFLESNIAQIIQIIIIFISLLYYRKIWYSYIKKYVIKYLSKEEN